MASKSDPNHNPTKDQTTMTTTTTTTATREPLDTAARQQRMKAWTPILHPLWVIATLILIGVTFIPIGIKIKAVGDEVVEYKIQYDSYRNNTKDEVVRQACGIETANEGKSCLVEYEITQDMKGPIMVYYEIENFYQNHREYYTSRDDAQLLGSLTQSSLAASQCNPLNVLGNITLNPCGLIANTFFNDVITFLPNNEQFLNNVQMIEDGIAWQSDLDYRFRQPDGFQSEECDCATCVCESPDWSCMQPYEDPKDGKCYRYFYPNDDTTQYLHETYPMISPIKGVTDEHFVVWMRVASFPYFRKLYGYFENDFKVGDIVSFQIENNWQVKRFKGSKSLVITTTSRFGGKSDSLGDCFLVIGGCCIIAAAFFAIKHIFKPRRLGDEKYLKYKVE